MTQQTALTASCPECAADVGFAEAPMESEIVPCADCGADLEVRGTSPITLETAPEVEEDWGE
ncbi:MAG: lysine biosynthesis protein LysW [Planctomycetota bacterium JB042]